MIYASVALRNVTAMASGSKDWLKRWNDLWHWFKHARPYALRGLPMPDMAGLPSEDHYVALAAEICRQAADGVDGTEVRVRESTAGSRIRNQYLVWYCTRDMYRGIFVIVNDELNHGELVTMFSPDDGYDYYENQQTTKIQ